MTPSISKVVKASLLMAKGLWLCAFGSRVAVNIPKQPQGRLPQRQLLSPSGVLIMSTAQFCSAGPWEGVFTHRRDACNEYKLSLLSLRLQTTQPAHLRPLVGSPKVRCRKGGSPRLKVPLPLGAWGPLLFTPFYVIGNKPMLYVTFIFLSGNYFL